MGGELLPEAGREEEGVVGGRADDQDGEDALHLSVDPDGAPVGEGVDDRAGEGEGEHGRHDDHEREEDAPVHQEQDQQDGAEGDAEQQPVDAGEGVGEVGLRGRGTRDVRGGARYGRGRRAHRFEDGGEFFAQVRVERHDGLERPAVLGGPGGRGGLGDAGPARECGDGAGRSARLVSGDPGALRGLPDDDRGNRLRAFERPPGFEDGGGLGTAGQEGRLVVGGDLAQLSRVGAERAADAQPDHQQGQGNQPQGPARIAAHVNEPPFNLSIEKYVND
ncbi:hypothetical protein GCM10009731_47770 [Streptomyces globosus]